MTTAVATKQRELLPTNIKPSHYNLSFKINFDDESFSGSEEVDVEVLSATSTITLHSLGIQIQSANLKSADGSVVEKTGIEYDEKKQTATIAFGSELRTGKATLSLTFDAKLNKGMVGLYINNYMLNGQKRIGASTQFESTDARRAFPCWDEPLVKATFSISLTVPEERTAVSNMPVIEEKKLDGSWKKLTYDKTPIMSTYLVAFVVGDFDFVEGHTKEGIKVRVYTPIGRKDDGVFALDVAVRTLTYFKEYFGIAYPLPKLDMLAIADFAFGAMENWGCVTYRESALLINPNTSSISQKQRVAYVVAHELAHQWFGNLVTMEWWTHLWLNEGFATWVGNLAVNEFFPHWAIWTDFITSHFSAALKLDQMKSSHPIEVEVTNAGEIGEIFDAISYNKGASVIRMLENLLGAETFKKGLHNYLKKHTYANAGTEDLWDALADASGKPVKKIMDSWTKATGYPLLDVQKVGDKKFSIQQSRFGLNGLDTSDKTLWSVPLTILSDKSKDVKAQLIEQTKEEVTIDYNEWFKLNFDQIGFYRVKYPAEILSGLSKAVSSLSPCDRLGLQNDAFALATSGLLPTTQVLELVLGYKKETDYNVVSDLASNLGELNLIWSNRPESSEALQKFLREIYSPMFESVGWDATPDEDNLKTLLRSLVLSGAGNNGNESVINEAKKRFKQHTSGEKEIVPDLRSIVFSLSVKFGGKEEWETCFSRYASSTTSEEKLRYLQGLCATRDPELITKTLDWSVKGDVRDQDLYMVFAILARNQKSRDATWKFFRDHYDELHTRFQGGGALLGRMVQYTTERYATNERADEVEKFFAGKDVGGIQRSIQQSVEHIRSSATWLSRDAEAVDKWLAAHSQ